MISTYSRNAAASSFAAKLISRPKKVGPGDHYAVVLADQSVIEFDPTGVNVTNLRDFANGATISTHAVAPREALPDILNRTHKALKQDIPYRLFDSNCEHFARWLIGLPKESKQISLVVVLSLLATLLYAAN